MKSTKAMEIKGVGCVVQVTTQQGNNVAEALTFVPGVEISREAKSDGEVVSRELVKI
jgi:nitrate reductase NapAB chaperone NapD